MHPRNRYRTPPDFVSLADAYEPLRHFLITSSHQQQTIDFKNADAQRRLTEAIMHRDFEIKLHIPPNRLCPPVPNRLNYVLWIQDIVYAHDTILESRSRVVRGIDVGTGASAIYPFLACHLEPDWKMVATELDEESYAFALKNISTNNMESQIDLRKASPAGDILFPLMEEGVQYEFSMCNPPFYGSAQEISDLAEEKELPPNAVCTGTEIEMIYPDEGEAGFVGRMVRESEKFQTRCKWYTSMLGKMSSILSIVELLQQLSISNYAITEFVQGQTRRWAIAWSFTDTHLPDVCAAPAVDHEPSAYIPSTHASPQSIARIPFIPASHALHPVMPPRNTLSHHYPKCTLQILQDVLAKTLRSLELEGVTATEVSSSDAAKSPYPPFLIEAMANTWSRSARRSHQRRKAPMAQMRGFESAQPPLPAVFDMSTSSMAPVLTCSARVITQEMTAGSDSELITAACNVEFQWIFGKDRGLFESLTSHVSRKVGAGIQTAMKQG